MLGPQIILLPSRPRQLRFEPPRNPPGYHGEDMLLWLIHKYRGNKPSGGLWTSTHTPDDEYQCDWQRGLATNQAIKIGYPGPPLPAFLLTPAEDARVIKIDSFDEAQGFSKLYHAGAVPIPDGVRQGVAGALITTELTDWERASKVFDAVQLTAQGADEVMYAHLTERIQTAFDTWNCESTFWFRWRIAAVEDIKNRSAQSNLTEASNTQSNC